MEIHFSVLIPMEFHRGLVAQCVAGWTRNQSYARRNFEVLVAAPFDGDEAELREVKTLLAPQDRLLRYQASHDMPLVAAAAKEARGEVLVLTEAHCLPRPDFLTQAANVLLEKPTWKGFSGRSIPMTHNLLSEIEADMYDGDIRNNLENHPWLKVLDQCFVIRREAYQASGGLEPEYGHFAEWLLAARLFRQGFVIGYDPRPAIEHYYCGDLTELETFTKDFAAGQIRFAHASTSDPCRNLFEPIAKWSNRQLYQRSTSKYVAGLLVRDFARTFGRQLIGRKDVKLSRWPWRTAGTWLARRWMPTRAILRSLQNEQLHWRRATQEHLKHGSRSLATEAFQKLLESCCSLGHSEYVSDWCRHNPTDANSEDYSQGSDFTASESCSLSAFGFHEREEYDGQQFRWSEPIASVELPKSNRCGTLTIEWLELRPSSDRLRMRFYLDKNYLSPDCISHGDLETSIKIQNATQGTRRLAWICDVLHAPNDKRLLGMAVAKMDWQEADRESLREMDGDAGDSLVRQGMNAHDSTGPNNVRRAG